MTEPRVGRAIGPHCTHPFVTHMNHRAPRGPAQMCTPLATHSPAPRRLRGSLCLLRAPRAPRSTAGPIPLSSLPLPVSPLRTAAPTTLPTTPFQGLPALSPVPPCLLSPPPLAFPLHPFSTLHTRSLHPLQANPPRPPPPFAAFSFCLLFLRSLIQRLEEMRRRWRDK